MGRKSVESTGSCLSPLNHLANKIFLRLITSLFCQGFELRPLRKSQLKPVQSRLYPQTRCVYSEIDKVLFIRKWISFITMMRKIAERSFWEQNTLFLSHTLPLASNLPANKYSTSRCVQGQAPPVIFIIKFCLHCFRGRMMYCMHLSYFNFVEMN